MECHHITSSARVHGERLHAVGKSHKVWDIIRSNRYDPSGNDASFIYPAVRVPLTSNKFTVMSVQFPAATEREGPAFVSRNFIEGARQHGEGPRVPGRQPRRQGWPSSPVPLWQALLPEFSQGSNVGVLTRQESGLRTHLLYWRVTQVVEVKIHTCVSRDGWQPHDPSVVWQSSHWSHSLWKGALGGVCDVRK